MPPHSLRSPVKKNSKWSAEEDAILIRLREAGTKWKDISEELTGRSGISCRLRYQNYLVMKIEWDEERKDKLARLYERFKHDMWAEIAEELAVSWRAAEAMHWQLGYEEMWRRGRVVHFAPSTKNYEVQPGGVRELPRHAHSSSHGSLPRDMGYGRGATLPSGRPLASRRDSLLAYHHHCHAPAETFAYPHHGEPLAPIQTWLQPQGPPPPPPSRQGGSMVLPGVAEITTGVNPYSTPVYSASAPSASPAHSARTAVPGPYIQTRQQRYANGWPVLECISAFERLAQVAFKLLEPWIRIPFLSELCQFITSVLSDSRYSGQELEKILKEVLGTRSIVECSQASEMGAKIGIPVATVQDSRACVFTSYNGAGERPGSSGDYQIIPPSCGLRHIPLWEIVMCATAAP
ncbi:Uu.00g136740.m01.CDS01 [Anthostomella pinea]|uniref:Uu.00g136740.m01.CDS01 n=1 Tax=Anthostomella pinea TaxID=933095 RepID=A0AAI8VQ07_9PEZI|nr:Uu.00g136740.m01.CDS01 [Anthostomella pinea]